ncbi:hypothetical protein [Pseudomonas canadensis]|uniref:hypothetical protein n=1 Tax=Pseudomonas canadensis TaxID=915099 RepID=UPI003BA31C85
MPFIVLALLIPLSLDYRALFAIALVNYDAAILSFIGALHCSFAMTVQDMSTEQAATGSSGVSFLRFCLDCNFTANAIELLAVGHRLSCLPPAVQATVAGCKLARLGPTDAITAYPCG